MSKRGLYHSVGYWRRATKLEDASMCRFSTDNAKGHSTNLWRHAINCRKRQQKQGMHAPRRFSIDNANKNVGALMRTTQAQRSFSLDTWRSFAPMGVQELQREGYRWVCWRSHRGRRNRQALWCQRDQLHSDVGIKVRKITLIPCWGEKLFLIETLSSPFYLYKCIISQINNIITSLFTLIYLHIDPLTIIVIKGINIIVTSMIVKKDVKPF